MTFSTWNDKYMENICRFIIIVTLSIVQFMSKKALWRDSFLKKIDYQAPVKFTANEMDI